MAIFSLTRGIILVIIMIIVYLAFIGSSKKTREGYTGETPNCDNLQADSSDPPWTTGANQNPGPNDPSVSGDGWTQDHTTGAYICPPTACYNEHGMSDDPRKKCMLPVKPSGLDWIESKGQIMNGAGCNVTMATIEECPDNKFNVNGQMGPLNKCGWQGEKAAKAGCINWTECGGFTCVPNKSTGFCYAAPMGGNIVINKVKGLDTYDAFLKPPLNVPNVKAGICAGAISAALINTGGGDGQCSSSVPNQPTNCVWGEWSDWGPCTAKCGELATQKSTREIKIHAENGGIDCSGETVRTRSSGCDASNTEILPEKPSDYLATCKKPKDDPNAIPPSRYLPPPPKVTSLLGGLRPKTAIGNPTTTAEDAYNKIIYWQAKRNNNLTKQTMSVSNEMKKQKEANKKNIINDPKYRDYTKPDLRMFPLLESINQSLTKLTS